MKPIRCRCGATVRPALVGLVTEKRRLVDLEMDGREHDCPRASVDVSTRPIVQRTVRGVQITRDCDLCGATYTKRYPSQRSADESRFCSPQCGGRANAKHRLGPTQRIRVMHVVARYPDLPSHEVAEKVKEELGVEVSRKTVRKLAREAERNMEDAA